MISGSAATTGATQTRTTLSYVNNLVTGATSSGSYHIYVPNDYMDDDMMDDLIGYGLGTPTIASTILENEIYLRRLKNKNSFEKIIIPLKRVFIPLRNQSVTDI